MLSLYSELKRKISIARVLTKASLIVAISLIISSLIALTLYQKESDFYVEKMVSEASINSTIQQSIISNKLRDMAHSLLFFAGQVVHHQAISSKEGRVSIGHDFLAFMLTNTTMDQVRLLNESGLELVRVNFNSGKPHVVEMDVLQNKSDRYYFKQMLKLQPNELYISNLDLNVENSKVEVPHKPVIRMGIRINDEKGERIGFLLINYLTGSLLDQFNRLGSLELGDSILLDSKGNILASPGPENSWKKITDTIYNKDSSVSFWEQISASEESIIHKKKNIYVSSTIHGDQEVLEIPAIKVVQQRDNTTWKAVVYFGEHHLDKLMESFRNMLIMWIVVSGVIFLLISFPLALMLERKRISSEYYSLLSHALDHASDAIMVTKPNSEIEYINPSFSSITGYSADEAIGGYPSQLLRSSVQKPAFYKKMWEGITSGNDWFGEIIDRRKDGALFPAEMSITPIKDINGNIEHYVSILRDNTANKLLQDRLLQEKKMQSLSIAVGGIAHEFNNLLAGLMGNTYLVKALNKDNPTALIKLTAIESLGFRAAEMIQQMLSFVGKGQFHPSEIDVAALFNNILNEQAVELPEKVTLNVDFPSTELLINADAASLRHVCDELLSNAVFAVANCENPEISLSLSTETRKITAKADKEVPCVVFTVMDNGSGVEPEHIELLFEPFFTTREVGKGEGLGLADVYGIINTHQGTIEVDSKPESGSTFRVVLPRMIG